MLLWNFRKKLVKLCYEKGMIILPESVKLPEEYHIKKYVQLRQLNRQVFNLIDKSIKEYSNNIHINKITPEELFNMIFPYFDLIKSCLEKKQENDKELIFITTKEELQEFAEEFYEDAFDHNKFHIRVSSGEGISTTFDIFKMYKHLTKEQYRKVMKQDE